MKNELTPKQEKLIPPVFEVTCLVIAIIFTCIYFSNNPITNLSIFVTAWMWFGGFIFVATVFFECGYKSRVWSVFCIPGPSGINSQSAESEKY